MRRQIISRAFYGWLAHCRHLKTVRHHLGGLALHQGPLVAQNGTATSPGLSEEEWAEGLTKEYWNLNVVSRRQDPSGKGVANQLLPGLIFFPKFRIYLELISVDPHFVQDCSFLLSEFVNSSTCTVKGSLIG